MITYFRYWKTILGLVAVFVAGIAIGGIGTVRMVKRVVADRMDSTKWTSRTLSWLHDEVQLTPEQESAARPAVEKMTHEFIDLRAEAEGRRREIYGRMLLDVAAHLTPDQQQRLKSAIKPTPRTFP